MPSGLIEKHHQIRSPYDGQTFPLLTLGCCQGGHDRCTESFPHLEPDTNAADPSLMSHRGGINFRELQNDNLKAFLSSSCVNFSLRRIFRLQRNGQKIAGCWSMHVNEQYDYLLESFLCIMFICTYKCITIVCCELVLTSLTWCSTLWALLTTFDHFAGQQFPSLGQCKVWAANAMHESKSNLNIQIMERDLFLVYPIFLELVLP